MPDDGDEHTPVDKFRWLTPATGLKRPETKEELFVAYDEMVRRYQDQRDKTLVILREDDQQRADTLAVLRDIKRGMATGFPMPLWGKINLALTAGLILAVAVLFYILFRPGHEGRTTAEHAPRTVMSEVVGALRPGQERGQPVVP